MANTFTQIHVQFVFAVKNRQYLIHEKYRIEIQKYITGIVNNKRNKMLSIYCNPDHIHLFIGLNPNISVADAARDIKANSSRFINDSQWYKGQVSWQKGYGAFSYSHSAITNVCKYIENQAEHHKRSSFKEEYLGLLKKFEIDYNETYLFEWI